MSDQRFAIIDPAAGASGDMLLGALIAAGASPDWLMALPGRLGLDGVTVSIEPAVRSGIAATRVLVRAPDGRSEGPGDHHHGPHRHLGELLRLVERAPISPWVRERALLAFRLLGEAEGRVHGVPPERVSLHEVGALDALVDIVGAVEGFEQLGVTDIRALPIALGSGWVRAAHGTLPVPAPATAVLVEGLTVGPDGPVEGEATTPTGAALIRALTAGQGPPERWRPIRSGWGAGTRNPPGYPNALRLMLAEPVDEAAEVVLLATDIDDMSPEYLSPLRAALTDAGALDVVMWSTQMKKERFGFRVEVVAAPDRAEQVIEAMFAHSTTTGIRRTRATRETLVRRIEEMPGTGIRVKISEAPGGPRAKPEFEDIRRTASSQGRPVHDVAAELMPAAQALAGSAGSHKEQA